MINYTGLHIVEWRCGDECDCACPYLYDGNKRIEEGPYICGSSDDYEGRQAQIEWIRETKLKHNIIDDTAPKEVES